MFAIPDEIAPYSNSDTEKLQLAINDGRPVFLNRDYFLDQFYSPYHAVLLRPNLIIYGNNCKLTPHFDCEAILYASGSCHNVSIENLRIDCISNIARAKVGILMNNDFSPYLNFNNVFINDAINGVVLSTFVSTFTNVRVKAKFGSGERGFVIARKGWYSGAEDSEIAGTSLTFNSCFANGFSKSGYFFHQTSNSTLNACAADMCVNAYEFRQAKGIAMNGCGAEKCHTWCNMATETEALTINSGFFLHPGHTDQIWFPSDPPNYWLLFRSDEGGVVQINGFTVASIDNQPNVNHVRVAGNNLKVYTVGYWHDIGQPSFAVFPNNTVKFY
jgi:hypothetical protein